LISPANDPDGPAHAPEPETAALPQWGAAEQQRWSRERVWRPYEDTWLEAAWLRLLPRYWFEAVHPFWSVRWLKLWPLQRRYLGDYSLGELLFFPLALAFMLCTAAATWYGEAGKDAGTVSSLVLGLAFAFASRNSVWSFLLGMPFERALKYHKFVAVCSVVLGVWHGFLMLWLGNSHHHHHSHRRALHTHGFNCTLRSCSLPDTLPLLWYDGDYLTGTLTLAFMLLLVLSAFFPIRRACFDLFYRFHWLFFVATMVVGCLHGASPMMFGAALWLVDLLLRMHLARNKLPRTAHASRLASGVVELCFSGPRGKVFDYKGGQYVFLCVPEISLWEWHPFSISSAPHEPELRLHVRPLGDWTRRLAQLAKDGEGRPLQVLLEGPYGAVGLDLDSGRYKVLLLLGGGIGVTPMQSVCLELLHAHSRGRPLRRLLFVWSVRDSAMLQGGLGIEGIEGHVEGSDAGTSTTVQMPSLSCGGPGGQQDKAKAGGQLQQPGEAVSPRLPPAFSPDLLGRRLLDDKANLLDEASDPVLRCEYYLTRPSSSSTSSYPAGSVHQLAEHTTLHVGERPPLPQLFSDARDVAQQAGEAEVAVLVCGPAPMVAQAQHLCRVMSTQACRFELHKEVFAF